MNWKQQWINQVLEEVPAGKFRGRMEAELRDHLETQYRALTESGWPDDKARAEALRIMGEPETLQQEYQTAWRRSLPARLEALGYLLGTWVKGLVLMFGTLYLACCARNMMYDIAPYSPNPLVKTIRRAIESWNILLIPLALSLLVGAFYLRRKFETSRRPVAPVCAGLFVHWGFITTFNILWDARDHHHRPFWDAVARHLAYNFGFYAFTFLFCVLLGLVFGLLPVKKNRIAAA